MMVVGPSMSGKGYFVKEILERDRIEYEDHRKRPKIYWFYEHMFKDMRRWDIAYISEKDFTLFNSI